MYVCMYASSPVSTTGEGISGSVVAGADGHVYGRRRPRAVVCVTEMVDGTAFAQS